MKDVKDWTDEEALVHVEAMLELFYTERHILFEGRKAESRWACNRGGDSALRHLEELTRNYQRMINVVTDRIRSKKHETIRSGDSLEGK